MSGSSELLASLGSPAGATPGPSDTSGQNQPYTNLDSQSNLLLGAHMAAQEEGSKSTFDIASDLVTKAAPLTGAAIFNSFYNTAAEVGNFFGANIQKSTIEDQFGPDSDTTAYYQNHAGVIEGTALAVGSLLPGIGATKVLKLAQAGTFGETISTVTGLASKIRQGAIDAAAVDLAGNTTGTSLFGLNAVNKTKAILAGVADSALQGAVYETATLATMHASPITDQNTLADDISDVWDSAKSFGVIGGLLEGAGAFSKINKASKLADMVSKKQEAFGSLGLGNVTPGDRAVALYDTLDSIPAPTSRLESMKLTSTTNTTGRQIQEQLLKAAGGDEELAGSFRKFLEDGRKSGSIGPSELQNNLGQLTKIGRHGDVSIASQASDVFYLPSKVEAGSISTVTHDELLQKISSKELGTLSSRALSLTNPNQLPTIGRASDSLSLPGLAGQKYAGALDAYKQGVDIYLDSQGAVHINPASTAMKEVARPGESRVLTRAERLEYQKTGNLPADSKPLNAVGLTLDLTSGKLFGESPLPVVGDIGKPSLLPDRTGIRVGDTTFSHRVGQDLDLTNPLNANSRYVWASLRGIRNGDSISATDLPMMEQAYRELAAGNNSIVGNGIKSFSDGSPIPTDAAGMLQKIADTKQSLYADLLSQGKNADEIGMILNAPTEGLTKNFNTQDASKLISPPEQSSQIRHVRLAYDIGSTRDSEGNLLRGTIATNYRAKLAKDANSDQMANYLAKTVGSGDTSGAKATSAFSSLQFTKGAGDADIAGAGSSFFSNANGQFGSMAQQAERIGRSTSELSVLRHSVVSDTLSSATSAIRNDPVAAAEYGNFVAVRRSTGEHFVLLSDADAAANSLAPNTAILEGAVTKDPKTGAVSINKNYIPAGFVDGAAQITDRALKTFYTLSPKVADLEKASQSLNNSRNSLRSDWWKAQGVTKDAYNPDRLYTPPIDASKYPFMAYVRQREGYALGESGASVVTATSAEDLQKKISLLGPDYDAFTKNDIANFKKAQGEFEFNRNFMSNRAGTELARKGILNNVVPETRAQNLIDELATWHFRHEDQLLRDHVELHNASTFAQLKAMGDRFDLTGTSRFGAITPFMQRTSTNPYMSYVRTALGLSSKDAYPLWQLAQEKLESFAGTAFNTVRDAFGATRKGLLSVEDASKISEKFGLGNPYGTTLEEMSKSYYGGLANQLPSSDILRRFTAGANTILGATVIRLDTFQQLIHAVTLPIMVALEHGSASRDLQELLSVSVPGTETATQFATKVPGFSRTLFNAVRNYFGADGDKLSSLYSTATGLTRDELTIHRQMINELSMPLGKLSESGWAQKLDRAAQYGEKITGTKFTNSFIHFVASDVGRQIGEASGQVGQDLLDSIGTFTGRVLGNVAAGQRAGVFSGPVGQAVGLFQSYQWNLMQQLLRHIGDGDVKALAMGAGMQSSIFGLSSLPGFHALNSLIADRHGNTQGKDLYSATNELTGTATSNYLLYGGLSGLLGTALYSRGDLNPRRASILPTNPLNFPSVAAGIRVYQTLAQLESNISTKGGSVPASLLLAAEHNGLSRPLAGLAELVQGFSTDPKGNLISKVSGMSDLASISNMSRILGARPLEESVAMDAMYRKNSLQLLDNARMNELGQAAKTAMYAGSQVAPEVTQQFLADYVKAGGNQGNFNKWFLDQSKGANISAVNRSMENFTNPRAQTLQRVMGGVLLPDYRNTGSVSQAQSAGGTTEGSP
jgi:hypothetical protein